MIFTPTGLTGAFAVDIERLEDERGFFARSWCGEEFEAAGLNSGLVQCSLSRNRHRRTLRGLHYQVAPHEEVKLVRCTMGAIYDVIVDLRPDSDTYLQHFGAVLSAENHQALYVPAGCAHGFLTLVDECEVFYQMTAAYARSAARGLRWDDPLLAIRWPAPVAVIAERDRTFPDFEPTWEKELAQ